LSVCDVSVWLGWLGNLVGGRPPNCRRWYDRAGIGFEARCHRGLPASPALNSLLT